MTKLAPPCVKEIKNCLSDRDFKALKHLFQHLLQYVYIHISVYTYTDMWIYISVYVYTIYVSSFILKIKLLENLMNEKYNNSSQTLLVSEPFSLLNITEDSKIFCLFGSYLVGT